MTELAFWTETVALWRELKVSRPGATRSELVGIETKYGARLSPSFCDLYLASDGMRANRYDRRMLRFLPLMELEPAASYMGRIGAKGYDGFLAFAEWSLSAHAYAIHLDERIATNPVALIGSSIPIVVAPTFDIFLSYYINEPNRLFPDLASQ